MRYRQEREILGVGWDLDDLEKIVDGTPSSRKTGDIANKLYKLINEGSFQNCWMQIGLKKFPMINTQIVTVQELANKYSDLRIQNLQNKFVSLAPIYGLSGGITFYDMDIDWSVKSMIEESVARYAEQVFKIAKFADSSGMYAKGNYIKRQTAINFVRNKRGGAHALEWKIDQKDQKKSYDVLALVYDPQLIDISGFKHMFQLMDGDVNQLEQYIWNIAIDLIYSEDTQIFLEAVRTRFPNDFN